MTCPGPSCRYYGEEHAHLPERAVARSTDPETSHAAARSVASLNEKQRAVLHVLEYWGACTDEELFGHPSISGNQSVSGARTRRSELTHAGLVRDSKKRRVTRAGRRTIVWELTQAGKDVYSDHR